MRTKTVFWTLLITALTLGAGSPGWTQGTFSETLAATPQDSTSVSEALDKGKALFDKGDYSNAATWYRIAAEQGDAKGEDWLGLCIFNQDTTKDHNQSAEAVTWFQKATDQGNIEAQGHLGVCYLYGWGVAKDLSLAVDLFQKSAAKGFVGSQNVLGSCYYDGTDGITQDYKKAFPLFKKSAAQGDMAGQYRLGLCYEYGHGVKKNLAQAKHYLQLSAKQGNPDAKKELSNLDPVGRLLNEGEDDFFNKKDYPAALKLLKEAAAKDNAQAQFDMGCIYSQGLGGTPVDYQQALQWYQMGVLQGDASNENGLGVLYKDGKGVEQDDAKAVSLFQLSSAQGWGEGETDLANMYENGTGVAKDLDQAKHWYQLAADQGVQEAKNALQRIANGGAGNSPSAGSDTSLTADQALQNAQVAENKSEYSTALDWYRKAADLGSSDAQLWFGRRYEFGAQDYGIPEDQKQMVQWYQKSVQQGNSAAEYELAEAYYGGEGVAQDCNEALKWMKSSALHGFLKAQNQLGFWYGMAHCAPMDLAEAKKWFQMAAQQGDADAQEKVNRLAQQGY